MNKKKNTNVLQEHYFRLSQWVLSIYEGRGATSEDVFDYLFNVRAGKFLSEKGKKYLHELFEKWDPEYLQLNEDLDYYLDNNSLKDIIRDECM